MTDRTSSAAPPGFVRTVRLLLGAARRRAVGRRARQRVLLRQRAGKPAGNWSGALLVLTILFMALLNVIAGVACVAAVMGAEQVELERHGTMVVEPWFAHRVAIAEQNAREAGQSADDIDRLLRRSSHTEAVRLTRQRRGDAQEIGALEARLRTAIHDRGAAGLAVAPHIMASMRALPSGGRLPALLGSLVLVWWSMMLVFQGEGLELDIQRRRHPMWEWLLSHPVPTGAVFFAEMLFPLAANPIYQAAPLFAGVLYGVTYDPWRGVAAAVLIGLPVAVGASCLGKAIEVAVMLRCPLRSRGAIIGAMGWLGYAAMVLFLFAVGAPYGLLTAAASILAPLTAWPWPWLGLFLGQDGAGFSFARGVLTCWAVAAATIAGSVAFSVWGAEKGLSAPTDSGISVRVRAARFGRNALYRKEALWFARDRSAIVQAVLIPVTLAGFQLINLRHFAAQAQGAWNTLCGAAILFGTYFLWVLGPKSLASEGAALWIATTWPQGLEDMLRAKAWLWSLLSSAIVAPVLGYAIYLYPGSFWKVALVGAGWFLFARSMAAKSVTLAVVTSESGEAAPVPRGRRLAAGLGMLTFCLGIVTERYTLAITGIVFSIMTAAAMWQNFRARLPYLFDPWSEILPPAPTLMHAMIAISLLVEVGAAVTGGVSALGGRDAAAVLHALMYAICAAAVSIGTAVFLDRRGVSLVDIWFWPNAVQSRPARLGAYLTCVISRDFWRPLLTALIAGLVLGCFGLAYLAVLNHIPALAGPIHQIDALQRSIPHLKSSLFVMAVFIAPFAEEFLFRGLLYRALDTEWGGWRAVLGSAAFFASYHPALSWLPVGLLGVLNALMFRKTGRLGPAILTHMVYNAVVLL